MQSVPILIVGAGPTGLNLALSLARRGVTFRLISEDGGPGEHSRAVAVHARTLEFYAQYGFAEEVVNQGIRMDTAHLREAGKNGGSREVLSFSFRDLGEGLSPYPFVLAYPQDDHERFLLDKLRASGADVEWRCRLTGFAESGEGIRATLLHGERTEECEAAYICGCDGARSQVRQTLALSFPGGTYDQLFYVADVRLDSGLNRDLSFNLGEHILALMLPVRSTGMQRLIGLVPPELSDRRDLGFDDIRGQVEPLLDVKVKDVNWFSTYRVHHRVAERFRVGRAFLLGDAGHIHSPAGGQGMNTGIGDAVNLGWKLAQVLEGSADPSLLDSYEPERIAFARTLVSTTDRAFTPMVAGGVRGEFVRKLLAPLFLATATRFTLSRHAIFRVVSQTRIRYPDSPLSEGAAGEVHAGDRLPWIDDAATDNFDPLRSLDWQMHVYGELDRDFETACHDLRLAVHVFAWSHGAEKVGLKRSAAYLVRPDGYIALASAEQSTARLKAFTDRHRLRFAVRSNDSGADTRS